MSEYLDMIVKSDVALQISVRLATVCKEKHWREYLRGTGGEVWSFISKAEPE